MTQVLDSYTGEPYVEDYISPILNIRRGRESFWRRAEMLRAAEQYWVSPVFPPEEDVVFEKNPIEAKTGGQPYEKPCPATPCPSSSPLDPRFSTRRPSGWLLRRKDSPSDLFPLFASQDVAVRVMDWCVKNDASVAIVIHWLARGNPTPFLCLMQDITKVALDA